MSFGRLGSLGRGFGRLGSSGSHSSGGGDVTAPVLTLPTDVVTGSTTADLGVTTDEGNGTLYWVLSTSATPPTAAQVKAGQDNTGSAAAKSGSQAVSGTGVQSVSATALTADTQYYAHLMHEDAAGNKSNVASGDGFVTYMAESQAFFARLVTPPTSARKALYNTFIKALVAAGVWAKLDVLYLFASADQATALTSLISSTFDATVVNSPTFTADSGFTGGATKRVSTNFNATTAVTPKFVQNSACTFAWGLKSGTDAGGTFGVLTAPNTYITPRYTDGNCYVTCNGAGAVGVAMADGAGLVGTSRSASNLLTAYKNGSSIGTNATASSAPQNQTFNFLSNGGDYAGTVAGGGFGSSLSAGEQLALYNAMHTFLQAVAGVP